MAQLSFFTFMLFWLVKEMQVFERQVVFVQINWRKSKLYNSIYWQWDLRNAYQ